MGKHLANLSVLAAVPGHTVQASPLLAGLRPCGARVISRWQAWVESQVVPLPAWPRHPVGKAERWALVGHSQTWGL